MKTFGLFCIWVAYIFILVGAIYSFIRFIPARVFTNPSLTAIVCSIGITLLFYLPIAIARGVAIYRCGISLTALIQKVFILGPSWFLYLTVLLEIIMQLYSGSTKEMELRAEVEIISSQTADQWRADVTRELKFEAILFAMLTCSTGIQFWNFGTKNNELEIINNALSAED